MALVAALAGCSKSSSSTPPPADDAGPAPPGAWLAPLDPNPRGPFPAAFMWGSATSAYQIEGGLTNTDWAAFENGHIAGGGHADDGPKTRTHYMEDIDAVVAMPKRYAF
jgi:beta-glucosidase